MKKESKGVLNADYAEDRKRKKELNFRFRVRAEAVCWAVKRFLKETEELTMLDMGAADGKTLRYMDDLLSLQRGIGIEYNPELIEKSGGGPDHLHFEQGDVTELKDISDNSISAVSALALLEHLPSPVLAIQQAARVLEPGGIFVASSPVPFWDHLAGKFGLLKEDQHERDMHCAFFKSLFKEVPGLNLVHFQRFMWAPIGILPYLGFSIAPERAFRIDRIIEKLKVTNWLFVNQLAVAIKHI